MYACDLHDGMWRSCYLCFYLFSSLLGSHSYALLRNVHTYTYTYIITCKHNHTLCYTHNTTTSFGIHVLTFVCHYENMVFRWYLQPVQHHSQRSHSKILQKVFSRHINTGAAIHKSSFRSIYTGAVSNTEYSDVTVFRAWLATFNAQTGLRHYVANAISWEDCTIKQVNWNTTQQ